MRSLDSLSNTVRYTIEPQHDKTNKMTVRPAKAQIILDIRPVWSESLLSVQYVAKDPWFLHADSEDANQTGRMPRLICCGVHMSVCWFCHAVAQIYYGTTAVDASQQNNAVALRTDEPRHDKTNKMSVRPAKSQISLGISPVWSESLLCAQWVAKGPSFLHVDNEDSDQTAHSYFVDFVMSRWLRCRK